MATEMEGPAPAATPAQQPHDELAEIRAEVAAGRPLVGSLATRFQRAVNAIDPAATEDSLAVLPGNRGVHLYDSLVAWASLVAGDQVLDLGCGSGGATRAAARAVGEEGMVVGIDSSPECIAEATARTPAGTPAMFRRGDITRLTAFGDRTFAGVVASMVLDQVDDLAPLLEEVFRVLRPGGRFVASVMSFDHLRPMDASFMGSVLAVVGRHAP
ncbi:MAG: methyltransferase domain-containing protein, partial [Thermoleophilia bacterium]|nr:methyltransferase domain-containing protein [Thermoleophilia bacterium]